MRHFIVHMRRAGQRSARPLNCGVRWPNATAKRMADTKQFYDDLSSYYHLIFEDWDVSMARQGNVLVQILNSDWEEHRLVTCECSMPRVALEPKRYL